jgi:predicted amidophosphoribosyltransferase
MGEKKCPHCGNWSEWSGNLDEACSVCGKPLGGKDLHYHQKRQTEKKANDENWIFYIKETDNAFVKNAKIVGNFFYTIYMAIITFLVWLIAMLPG